MPGQIVGQPAAKRRADDRRDHDGNAEQRKSLAALLRREGIRKDRLRHRHHAAAAEPLQDTEQQQHVEVRRETAQHRACGEQRQADEEERLAAEPLREEAARRQADGVGHEIGGHHPGRLVLAHAHTAGNVWQRHVGDRGVEHFHEGRERHEDGDQPRVRAGTARSCGSAGSACDSPHSQPRNRS